MVADKVLSTLRRHAAFVAGELVIVAVSGGGDSVALLHLLDNLKDRLGINLHVASIDHGIRAEAGRRDLDFVTNLAARWALSCTVDQADAPLLAREWGIGLEAAARRARYAFLAGVAREQGSKCVAVGHHAHDQAETILMNIIRGSGTRGLRGMRVVSEMPHHTGIRLARPLLRLAKDELLDYCRLHNLAYREDLSNDDVAYRRNFLRHEVMSRLQRLNPGLLDAFDRLAESADVDEDFVTSHFETAVMPMLTVSSKRWLVRREDFAALHPALQRRLLRRAFCELSGGSAVLTHSLTLDLIAWTQRAETGQKRDMSAEIQARMGYGEICIEHRDSPRAYEGYRLIPADADILIESGSPLDIHDLTVHLSTDVVSFRGGACLRLPAGLELRLRTRRPGDRFKPKGMGGRSRKVKDWMIDRKIPRELRSRIPLVCANGEIIAICVGATWHLADGSHLDARDDSCLTLCLV